MKPLIVLECPSCMNPVAATISGELIIDVHQQVSIIRTCARCSTEFRVMIGVIKTEKHVSHCPCHPQQAICICD